MRLNPPRPIFYISIHNDAAYATLSSFKQEEAQCLSLQMMPDSYLAEVDLLAICVALAPLRTSYLYE